VSSFVEQEGRLLLRKLTVTKIGAGRGAMTKHEKEEGRKEEGRDWWVMLRGGCSGHCTLKGATPCLQCPALA